MEKSLRYSFFYKNDAIYFLRNLSLPGINLTLSKWFISLIYLEFLHQYCYMGFIYSSIFLCNSHQVLMQSFMKTSSSVCVSFPPVAPATLSMLWNGLNKINSVFKKFLVEFLKLNFIPLVCERGKC